MSRKAVRPDAHRRPGAAAAALIATAVLAALAACSGGSSSSTGRSPNSVASSSSPSAVGYSGCMRSHGVPSFPDPDSSGNLPKADPQQLGVSNSQLEATQRACQHLLPNNGGALTAGSLRQCELTGDCPPVLVQQALTQLRIFARCMRSHGVPNWPDPTTDSQGRIGFDLRVSKLGFDPESPQTNTKISSCEHVMHPDIGVPLGVSR